MSPAPGFPFKGVADLSWPVCPNCAGNGQISQELAISGAKGIKGDNCSVCNGAGRVPDPSWPEDTSEDQRLSHGLGMLSPHVRESNRGVKTMLRAQMAELQKLLDAVLTVDPD